MPAPSPPVPSRDDLLADLDRLSQGRGLTYSERLHLRNSLDLPFIESQIKVLEARRRWQPVALGSLLVFAVFLLLIAGGAALDPATWVRALPSGLTSLVFLFAATTPFRAHRALSQKLSIYHTLRATAAPSPTA